MIDQMCCAKKLPENESLGRIRKAEDLVMFYIEDLLQAAREISFKYEQLEFKLELTQ
jgi:hypothetical protein